MTASTILLDEHVSRIFENVLRERDYSVEQAKDRFGEETVDSELLQWCSEHEHVLLSNNAKDFEVLHRQFLESNRTHAGIFLYREQDLPDRDPEGLARTVDAVFDQYGPEELENELVDLGEWYNWLHG